MTVMKPSLLSSKLFGNVKWELEEKDFQFIVGSKIYHINHIQAQILCPKIQKLQCGDMTVDKFYIHTNNAEKAFEVILNTFKGVSIEFPIELCKAINSIACELGNEEIFNLSLATHEFKLETIIEQLKSTDVASMDIPGSFDYVARSFHEIDEQSLMDIDHHSICKILSSKELTILTEKKLFQFIESYVERHKEASYLMGFVMCDFIDHDTMVEYINFIEKYQCHSSVWASICNRLLQDLKPMVRDKHHNFVLQKQTVAHDYEYSTEPFKGVFAGRAKDLKQSIVPSNVIALTSSSTGSSDYPATNVLQDDDRYWQSANEPLQWIQVDFINDTFDIKGYSIRSFTGPKSWTIQGSHDGVEFTMIEEVPTNQDLNNEGNYITKNFVVHKQSEESFRYIRFTQSTEGSHYYNNNQFTVHRLELFGTLYTLESKFN